MQGTPDHHRHQSRGERADQRADDEQATAAQQDPPLAEHVAEPARDGGGDRSAYLLLSRIDTQGPMSIGQLTDAFGLDTSTVNRRTTALLRAGLAERVPDPEGGIARKPRITDEGERRLTADRETSRSFLRQVVADWSEDEVRELENVLLRFNRSAEALEERLWPRPEAPETPESEQH
ncbi:MarR family winged helix-turn-helix transcriptional regulator [Streptomyces sp. NPDC004376]